MPRRIRSKPRAPHASNALRVAVFTCSAIAASTVFAGTAVAAEAARAMGQHATARSVEARAGTADFTDASLSRAARQVADWALASGDPAGLPFLIVDKRAATLYVFDANGKLAGSSAVLLGLARGDDSVPGIGERPMAQIRRGERTTPAGRFMAERGINAHGEDIMWIDYDAAVSMHRVRATNPKERRLERLRTSTIEDNRISYGCINVPSRFYDRHVVPAFAAGRAVVYVLPETRPWREQFGLGATRARAAG